MSATITVYAVQRELGSMLTTVRFKVSEQKGALRRVVDDCEVTLDGVHQLGDHELDGICESVYRQEIAT